MKSPRVVWLLALLAAVGLAVAIGIAWSRRDAPPAAAASTRPASQPSPTPNSPPPALAAALTQTDPRARAQAFGRELEAWLAHDLEGALAYVQQMPRGTREFSPALLMVLEALGRNDPDRALALARELITTRDEQAFYSALFDRLAREDRAAASARLALVPVGPARENALRAFTDAWAREDHASALAWAQALPDAVERNVAVETALRELTTADPMRAIELAQKSLTGPALERTVYRALQKIAETDPAGAAGLVALLPPGETQSMAAVDVAAAFSAKDAPGALAWAQTLPFPAQTLAFNRALTSWMQREPAAAARHVGSLSGPALTRAVPQIAPLYASVDTPGAIAWAGALPDEKLRHTANILIASAWAQRDPAAACVWAARLPAGAVQEGAVAGALSYWRLRDAAAAQAWLEAAPLPPELKAKLSASHGAR